MKRFSKRTLYMAGLLTVGVTLNACFSTVNAFSEDNQWDAFLSQADTDKNELITYKEYQVMFENANGTAQKKKYDLYDTDGNGSITKEEFVKEHYREKSDEEFWEDFLFNADADNNSEVSWAEYSAWRKKVGDEPSIDSFYELDTNKDKRIVAQEYFAKLKNDEW